MLVTAVVTYLTTSLEEQQRILLPCLPQQHPQDLRPPLRVCYLPTQNLSRLRIYDEQIPAQVLGYPLSETRCLGSNPEKEEKRRGEEKGGGVGEKGKGGKETVDRLLM